MSEVTLEDDTDDDPVLPYTRHPSLLDGLIRCDDCGEQLVGVLDARGVGYYVHEHEVFLSGADSHD